MGMEISSRRLQEADSRMQAEREGADRPVDDRDKERFDRAMQESRERDGQGGQENGRGGSRQDALSPQALLDSLFGSRMQSMQTSAAQAAPAPGDVDALVNELVDRILVSEPGKGSPEVRITLGQGPLSGAELCLARAQDGQLFIRQMHIAPYEQGNIFNKDPLRPRRLLMHKREIMRLYGKVKQDGYALIPLSVYFRGSLVKVEVALARGKKLYDKRDDAAKKDAKRQIDRAMKGR